MRILKWSHSSFNLIANNPEHLFANTYAAPHYDSDSVFTFIPKNGCTSLRASLAIANGFIPNLDKLDWIHNNNATLGMASFSELQKAKFTAIILRCPYRRITSAYLDKFCRSRIDSKIYMEHLGLSNAAQKSFNFLDFVRSLCLSKNLNFDVHWTPQISFMVYEKYDKYFNLDGDAKLIAPYLQKKCGFNFIDVTKITNNGTRFYEKVGSYEEYSKIDHSHIGKLILSNSAPSYASLFNGEIKEIIRSIYREDIDLFSRELNSSSLLYPPTP